MSVTVHPFTKMSAALLAAGVTAAVAPVVAVPGDALPAISTAAVRPASLITDALIGFGQAVQTATYAVSIPADLVVSLPFETLVTVGTALNDPTATGSLLSWLAQRYLNPSDLYLNDSTYPGASYSYPWDYKVSVLEPIVGALPAPLNATVIGALNGVADAIHGVLGVLPDPAAGADTVNKFWLSDGSTFRAEQLAVLAPVYALTSALVWGGYLPAELEATVEAAIAKPANLPGLLSYLAYTVLDPSAWGEDQNHVQHSGLLGGVLTPFVDAGSWLPAPLGVSSTTVTVTVGNTTTTTTTTDDGYVVKGYAAFSTAVNNLLNMLPAPVSPHPTPAAPATTGTAAVEANAVAAVEPQSASTDGVADVPKQVKAALTLDAPPATGSVAGKLAGDAKQSAVTAAEAPATPAADPQQGTGDGSATAADTKDTKDAKDTKDQPAKLSTKPSTKLGHLKDGASGSSSKPRHAKTDDSAGASGSSTAPRHAKAETGGSADAGGSADSGASQGAA